MIREKEQEVRDTYTSKILPFRERDESVPEESLTDFYFSLKSLLIEMLKVHYLSKLKREEFDDVLSEALSSVLLRIQNDAFPLEVVAWTNYLKRVLHGAYVAYIKKQKRFDRKAEIEIFSIFEDYDEYTMILDTAPTPENEAECKELSKIYLKRCFEAVRSISKDDESLAILAFYCYYYNIENEETTYTTSLPLSESEKVLLDICTKFFDYQLRTNRPEYFTIGV